MKLQLLIPAAGMGTRLGCDSPKALVLLEGESLLVRTLKRFSDSGLADAPVVVCPPDYTTEFEQHLARHLPAIQVTLVPGGAERQESVEHGLAALDTGTEIVAIHDAARPFVSIESVKNAITAAQEIGAATVAVPVIDTILQADAEAMLESTPDRARLWACQTPQVFQTPLIRAAHAWARQEGITATDDATLVRRMGHPVKLITGTHTNLKITTPEDMAVAAAFLREGMV